MPLTTITPWGLYENILETESYKIKRIKIKPHHRISLQSHKCRAEHWIIVQGIGRVTLGSDLLLLSVNQHVYVPRQVIHRIENVDDNIELIFIEIQLGSYLEEDDIIRYEDDYDRKIDIQK